MLTIGHKLHERKMRCEKLSHTNEVNDTRKQTLHDRQLINLLFFNTSVCSADGRLFFFNAYVIGSVAFNWFIAVTIFPSIDFKNDA